MSVNYNAIIGKHAKATLPSVEGWGSTNSILRDPPKSITTRRIDRVDADGSLNKLYADSGDRFSENINLYARGVNPFVAVQYSNNQYSGGNIGTSNPNGSLAAGKLPYRIMDSGAFRPPQLRQEQLLPLSRQPRNFTSMGSNPQFIDYTKTVMCQSQKAPVSFRQVKKPNMNVNTTATASKSQNIKIEGTKEHYININKHVIEDPTIVSAAAKISAKANLQIVNRENLREAKKQLNLYIVQTNKSENVHISSEPENKYNFTKNLPEYSTNTQKSDSTKYVHMEPEHIQERNRNLPEYSTNTQKSDSTKYVHMEPEHIQERNRNLPEYSTNTQKSDINKYVYMEPEHIQERNRNLPEYSTNTQKSDSTKYVHMEPEHIQERNRNLPEYSTNTQKSDSTKYVHMEPEHIQERNRNLPEYSTNARKNDSRVHIRIEPENEYVFEQKVTGSATTNINAVGDYEMNRDIKLPQTLNYGGFSNFGVEPTRERNIDYNPNYSTTKRDIANKILEIRG